MSAQAASAPDRHSFGRPAWLTLRTVRLVTGLVLFAYVTSHLVNHALGNISLGAMDDGLDWVTWVWRSRPVAAALYGSLAVHGVLGYWALYSQPRLSWRPVEMAQLALGLAAIPLLAQHVVGIRLAHALYGWSAGYATILYFYWVTSPRDGVLQALALLVAWGHGCLGLYLWLRLKPWFGRAAPYLLVAATLVPVLALLGYVQGGRAVVTLSQDAAWKADWVVAPPKPVPGLPPPVPFLDRVSMAILLGSFGLAAFTLAARIVRHRFGGRRGLIRLTYPDGAVARVPRGTSVLEASRLARIPHASVCGGRGRCSTCRVRLIGPDVGSPSAAEQAVLDRVGAGADVRLACQVRPSHDYLVTPLLSPQVSAATLRRATEPQRAGEERPIVAMFVDMRGSTRLAESRLPYDTVFVINRFLEAVGRGVAATGGEPNQFLGDGMMALFGTTSPPGEAARAALGSLEQIATNVAMLNETFSSHLDEPIRFGIGLHAGTAILGEIGDRDHGRVVFTAIGDPVNVAARLQGLTKGFGVEVVVSDAVFEAAGIVPDLPAEDVAVEGREGRLHVRLLARAADASALTPEPPTPGTKPQGFRRVALSGA